MSFMGEVIGELVTKAGRLPVTKLWSYIHSLRTMKVLVHQNFKSCSVTSWKTAPSIMIYPISNFKGGWRRENERGILKSNQLNKIIKLVNECILLCSICIWYRSPPLFVGLHIMVLLIYRKIIVVIFVHHSIGPLLFCAYACTGTQSNTQHASRWWMTSSVISYMLSISQRGAWNLNVRWRLPWHHTGTFITTSRGRQSNWKWCTFSLICICFPYISQNSILWFSLTCFSMYTFSCC